MSNLNDQEAMDEARAYLADALSPEVEGELEANESVDVEAAGEAEEVEANEEETEVEAKGEGEEAVEAEAEQKEAEKAFEYFVDGEEEAKTLSANTKFKIKSDKEEKELTLEEILNRASGDVAVEKRFSEIAKTKKELEERSSQISKSEKIFDNTLKKLGSENPFEAFTYLGEQAGIPALDMHRYIDDQIQKEVQRRLEMDDAELKNYRLEKENSFIVNNTKSRQEEYSARQADQEFQARMSNLKAQYGITDDEQHQAIEYIKSKPEDQQLQGLLKDPNKFVSEIVQYKKENLAIEALSSIDQKYAQRTGLILDTVALIENVNATSKEDLVEMIKSELGIQSDLDKAKSNVRNKVEKNKKASVKSVAAKGEVKSKSKGIEYNEFGIPLNHAEMTSSELEAAIDSYLNK